MKLLIPEFWKKRNYISYLLLPLSYLYLALFNIKKKITKKTRFNKTTIIIGNLTVGGAGKTPMAVKISQILSQNNLSNLFLSKGYLGKVKEPSLVPKYADFRGFGDEALLLFKTSKTITSNKKYLAKTLIEKQEEKIVIIDDGLQNHHLASDIKILVIDSNFLFGNELLLPAGPLRYKIAETLEAVDFIIIIGETKNKLFDKYQGKIFFCQAKTTIKPKKNTNYFAFSGLANNQKFFKFLKENKFNLKKKESFPDHHPYSVTEIEKLIKTAKQKKLQLITTSKDIVKIPEKYRNDIMELEISLDIKKESEFTKQLLEKINAKKN